MITWVYTLSAVLAVSLVSFIGIVFLSLQKRHLDIVVALLVSFAAGSFFGDVFFHLLPQAVEEQGWTMRISLMVLSGIVFFFAIEKMLHWRHCHRADCDVHSKNIAFMNLVGDGVHNFIDGLVIGASFLVSLPVGIATSLAVVFHEIPQEIGDFGVLLRGGFSRNKALFFNFFSSAIAILGSVVALSVGHYVHTATTYLVPFAIGGFIYIAGADLIPEIKLERSLAKSFVQLIFFILGAAVMAGLLVFENYN